ncbi:MAG TPA: MaoC family dehydratase [Inquilinus sp.]
MDDVTTRRDDAEGYFFEDLAVGMSANFGKTVTEADILMFSGVSGDTNPVHLNQVYAEGTRFRGRISHGLLSAGFISAVIGTRLPGPGSIYVSQTLQFKAPVRPGDTVTARVSVAGMMPERNRVVLQTRCYVGDRLVIDGEAVILVPSRGAIASSG